MAAGSCGGALPAGGGDAPVMSGGGGLTEGGSVTTGRGGGESVCGGGGSGGAPGIGEFGDGDEDDIALINPFSPFQLHRLKFTFQKPNLDQNFKSSISNSNSSF